MKNIVAITSKSRTPTNTFQFQEYALELFTGEMKVLHLINKEDLSYVVMGYSKDTGWVNLSGTGCTDAFDYDVFDYYRLHSSMECMISYQKDYVSKDFEDELSRKLLDMLKLYPDKIMELYKEGYNY